MNTPKYLQGAVGRILVLMIVAALGFAAGWLVHGRVYDIDDAYRVGSEVTVRGVITGTEITELIADDADILYVRLDNGARIQTYSYCGLTSSDEAVDADSNLEEGDRVEIFGKLIREGFIDVCDTGYSIRRL